jgi:hypothetical protein
LSHCRSLFLIISRRSDTAKSPPIEPYVRIILTRSKRGATALIDKNGGDRSGLLREILSLRSHQRRGMASSGQRNEKNWIRRSPNGVYLFREEVRIIHLRY